MNNKIKKVTLVLGVILIILGTTIVFSEPGSDNDPLVSLSYLEKSIEELKVYIDEKIFKIENNSQVEESNNLEVVEILSGQWLIGESGTEIILRGGKAEIVGGELGGLSDVTLGKDLPMGEFVPANHLLIIPRDDGRGVKATTNAIFLVRGEYSIR